MPTPFDQVITKIIAKGFHNHRLEDHSDVVGEGIFHDLLEQCSTLKKDVETGAIKHWRNVKTPGARKRRIDLLIGEPRPDGKPDLAKIRVAVENKSVVTAHRNRDARFDDLNEALQVIHKAKPETVIVATILIGLATRVLNIPDGVKKAYRGREKEFEQDVLPRLSRGDQRLWDEFSHSVSTNRPGDPQKTADKFRTLPTRPPAQTHVVGYDYILLVPILIDNVDPASLPKSNALQIDVEHDYQSMLSMICTAYTARWHPEVLAKTR